MPKITITEKQAEQFNSMLKTLKKMSVLTPARELPNINLWSLGFVYDDLRATAKAAIQNIDAINIPHAEDPTI